jgi:uncharacterized protein (DUF1778 family)
LERDQGAEPSQVRISISMEPRVRKMIRIAAAYADMEIGEWATNVLREAAEKAIGADRGVPTTEG